MKGLRKNLKGIALALGLGLATLGLGQTVSAQTRWKPSIAFGVKAGADMARTCFSPSIHQTLSPGATAGVTFRYIEEYHFGIIAEIDWTQRGWKEDFRTYTQFNYRRILNYLEIPVMAHIYFGRKSRFFFNAGPVISFLLGEATKANFDPFATSEIPDFPLTGRTNAQLVMPASKKFDYGICAGLGGELWAGKHNSIYLEGRFYYGLANIFPSARADTFHSSNAMVISATVGYWFNIR